MELHSAQGLYEVHASLTPTEPSTGTPATQKRLRDYGEELKGLSPSGDHSSPREQSTPAPKRQKVGYPIGAESNSDSDPECLNGDEIIESPLTSHVAHPISTQILHQDDVAPQVLNMASARTITSPEDGEIDESSGADGHSIEDQEVDRNIPPKETQETQGTQETQETQEQKNPSAISQQASSLGWNHGIQLGTRTKFGPKLTKSGPEITPAVVEATSDIQEQQKKKEKKRVRSRDPVSSFEASNATWNFPLCAPEIVAPANISQEDSFWVTLLKDWIIHLVEANAETADRLTYRVVRSGWTHYFTRRMGFLQGTKKHISATRIVAQNFMASLSKDNIDRMIMDARQKQPTDQPGNTGAPDSLLPSHNEELVLQRKYFSGADDPSLYCVSCSGTGHTTQSCPELSCRFCKSRGHNSFGCPTRRRCNKCRQTGHSVDACQEKLSLAPDELDGCAYCGSADHQDQYCFEIWRSFKPSEFNTRRVQSIPAFCYLCGGENHFGPECSLSGKGCNTTEYTTWSRANRDIYVDPDSEHVAIAWTDVDPGQRREFHILGRATRKIHTYFVSSDESEEDLIHAPVKKPQARGEIRIASNIGATNGNPRGLRDIQRGWQPPLPPGPPPSLAENGSRAPLQPASPGILPPRPQASAPSKPGRGRGGYRGRGRGRGRGK